MAFFGRRRHPPRPDVPPATEWTGSGPGVPSGWQPVPGPPFPPRFQLAVHEAVRALYGVPHTETILQVSPTTFSDVVQTSVDGRVVTAANSLTPMTPGLLQGGRGPHVATVVTAELPTALPVGWIRPRRYAHPSPVGETRTGNPRFDQHYQVTGTPEMLSAATGLPGMHQVLTPEVQQRILARENWIFHASHGLFGCIAAGEFRSPGEVSIRAEEVLGILAAIPASVVPSHVDHSADDLIARINQIDLQGAIALLESLTPAERDQLARSSTPLSAFADVRTPEEAMACFQSLDPASRMQIITMFNRGQGR